MFLLAGFPLPTKKKCDIIFSSNSRKKFVPGKNSKSVTYEIWVIKESKRLFALRERENKMHTNWLQARMHTWPILLLEVLSFWVLIIYWAILYTAFHTWHANVDILILKLKEKKQAYWSHFTEDKQPAKVVELRSIENKRCLLLKAICSFSLKYINFWFP